MTSRTSQKNKWDKKINEMMSMPFVRIDLILGMENEEIARALAEWKSEKNGITDYEEYLRNEEENRSELSLDARKFLGRVDEYDVLIEEFRNRVRHLLQLPDDQINFINVFSTIECYVASVTQLMKNINNENINSFIMSDRYLAVVPSLLSQDRLNDDDKLKIINKFEDIISKIEGYRANLSAAQLNDLILLVTHVVYCYKFYCNQYRIGTSTGVINYLYKMPKWMGTTYLSVEGYIKINFSLLCIHLSFDIFKWSERLETRLGISFETYNTLRFILNDALELLKRQNSSFYIPIYQWFISRIDSDITQYYANNLKLEYYDLHDIDRMKILACCERFSNYRYPVTIETVVKFIMQFKTRQDAESVIRLLNAIEFLEYWQLAERLESALQQMKKRSGDLALCPLGPVSGSTSLMHYYMAHSDIKGVTFFNSVTEAIRNSEKKSVICFIDDCAITGIQSQEIFQTLMGKMKPKDNEMIVLTDNDKSELLRRKVGVCLSLVSDTALNGLKTNFKSLDIGNAYTTYGSMILEKEKAFSPASRVAWKDGNERERMMLIFQRIGMRLLDAKAKERKWTRKEQRLHSLGYGDFQSLLVFPYSVPKPTIIALWAGIKDFSSPWKPLFPLAMEDDSYYPLQ